LKFDCEFYGVKRAKDEKFKIDPSHQKILNLSYLVLAKFIYKNQNNQEQIN